MVVGRPRHLGCHDGQRRRGCPDVAHRQATGPRPRRCACLKAKGVGPAFPNAAQASSVACRMGTALRRRRHGGAADAGITWHPDQRGETAMARLRLRTIPVLGIAVWAHRCRADRAGIAGRLGPGQRADPDLVGGAQPQPIAQRPPRRRVLCLGSRVHGRGLLPLHQRDPYRVRDSGRVNQNHITPCCCTAQVVPNSARSHCPGPGWAGRAVSVSRTWHAVTVPAARGPLA